MQDPILKLNSITKKRAGGVVQIVDHLPHKHEALSSSPSLKKKKSLGYRQGLRYCFYILTEIVSGAQFRERERKQRIVTFISHLFYRSSDLQKLDSPH
jgi:hypothetical protein